MANDWELTQEERWACAEDADEDADEDVYDAVNNAERAAQHKLVEWLKIVTVKADYADIGDIRIIAEPDWRRLCTSLGVGP